MLRVSSFLHTAIVQKPRVSDRAGLWSIRRPASPWLKSTGFEGFDVQLLSVTNDGECPHASIS